MALLKIARMGHPILMKPADPVVNFDDPELITLVKDMLETMFDAPGVGLAAPQVHVSRRVVVYYVPEGRDEGENPRGVAPTVLLNPVITPLGEGEDAFCTLREGCLSLPGMSGLVRRPKRIMLASTDFDGTTSEKELDGFHARVVQHECDHLDGILYPMRMDDLVSFGYDKEMLEEDEETE